MTSTAPTDTELRRSAELRDDGDRNLAPEELGFAEEVVDDGVLASARRVAFASGRVIEHERTAILTWGTAARLVLPGGLGEPGAARAAERLLAAIPPQSGVAAPPPLLGPPLLGALPFDRCARGELVVPEVAVVVHDGEAPRAITCGRRQRLEELRRSFPFAGAGPELPAPLEPPDRFDLVANESHTAFRQRVRDAVAAIEDGRFAKVVLARDVTVSGNRPFAQADLLARLRVLHPGCTAFALDGFIGASPELLVRRDGQTIASRPLAGTVARSGDPEDDERLARALLSSPKEAAEHRIVVEAVAAVLSDAAAAALVIPPPHLLPLRNVAHLATTLECRLPDGASGAPGALELAACLHPTPAVGGSPRDDALAYLEANEPLERGRYAGPVGYVFGNGDGAWWVGIRSAEIDGPVARLFAGVGIVAGSDPSDELVETQLKLQALLAVAVRP